MSAAGVIATMGSRVYLDWNATAPLRPAARQAMVRALDFSANPSSVHREGRLARRCIDDARRDIARLLQADHDDVVFTSGATEANAMVMASGWDTILVADVEHDSVRAAASNSTARVVPLRVNDAGLVTVDAVTDAIGRAVHPPGRVLLTVQAANNETGIIQSIAPVFAFARAHGLTTHCDAVQILGRLPFSPAATGADLISVSAHKLGGPQGIGALVIRDGVALRPMIVGGRQQRNRRAGTENVAAIAGFAAAATAALEEMALMPRIATLRDRLEERISNATPDAVVIGRGRERLPNTSCIALPGRSAETLVIAFDLAGIAISAGAACSSGKVAASAVLQSMGLPHHVTRGAVRFSIGSTTRLADIDRACDVWTEISLSASMRKPVDSRDSGNRTHVVTAQGD